LVKELIEKMRNGDNTALARLLTLVERNTADAVNVLDEIFPFTGNAHVIGITGPPGAGKSTLVDKLTLSYRKKGATVGILAVDPSSPYSGGALLGDRIRMQQHYLDSGVFIRSLATRGHGGGLPRAARGAIKVLDAAKKDVIILETVGVGQTELEIMSVADTIVVVLVPEAGDAIQTLKAGLLEIADIFVVNKSDRDGAGAFATNLYAMLNLAQTELWWRPLVFQTQATNGFGLDLLHDGVEKHRMELDSSGNLFLKRKNRSRTEFIRTIEQGISDLLAELEKKESATRDIILDVENGNKDPFVAASEVLNSGRMLQEWLNLIND
jgi:LAO/AO transport system kinase